jgi:hypothetical protein
MLSNKNHRVRQKLGNLLVAKTPFIGLLGVLIFAACSSNDSYKLVLKKAAETSSVIVEIHAAKPTPTWFGPHPIRVFLNVNGIRHLALEDRIANDGARLEETNFPINFEKNNALICFKGQEQTPVLYRVPFNGDKKYERIEEGC